jgi:hypothetical protein
MGGFSPAGVRPDFLAGRLPENLAARNIDGPKPPELL